MAIRKIRIDGDPILRKKSKIVKVIDDKVIQLVDDMKDTMRHAKGVGLAAVQVGILKSIIVISPYQDGEIEVLINPVINSSSGKNVELEACLSIPEKQGYVERPDEIEVSYMNINGEMVTKIAEDFEARVICHETDHTNGILYKDKMIGDYED